MLAEETTIPVYFALETEELSSIYEEIHRGNAGDQASTALEGKGSPSSCTSIYVCYFNVCETIELFILALMSGATANGFQMVVAGSQAKSLADFQITNIQVSLVKKKKKVKQTGRGT